MFEEDSACLEEKRKRGHEGESTSILFFPNMTWRKPRAGGKRKELEIWEDEDGERAVFGLVTSDV